MDHPGDDQRAGDAFVAALDVEAVEDFGEAEVVEGLEARALAADRARVLVLQGIEVDGGDLGLARLFLHRLGAFGDVLPLLARHRIVGAEIKQRPVAHLVADALGEHEPMASDRLAGLVGVRPGRRVERRLLGSGGRVLPAMRVHVVQQLAAPGRERVNASSISLP